MRDVLLKCFNLTEPLSPLSGERKGLLAEVLGAACRAKVYTFSVTAAGRALIFLCTRNGQRHLGIISAGSDLVNELKGPEDSVLLEGIQARMRIVQAAAPNAAWLRKILPHLNARPLGLKKSAGFGLLIEVDDPGCLLDIDTPAK